MGSEILRSSFEVRMTNGMVSALMTPSLGMLNCQTERSSSNMASKAWSTLSSSSMSSTHLFAYWSALRSGPALKNLSPCNSCLSCSHSTGPDLDRSSTASRCTASSNLPIAFSSLIPSKHCRRSTSVLIVLATASASSVLPLPGGPSSRTGLCSLAARCTTVAVTSSVM
jgi:hypothetical protein